MARKGEFKLTNEQQAEIMNRYQSGESLERLAKAFGVSGPTISRALLANGITPRHYPNTPTDFPKPTKFTDIQREEILNRYRSGETLRSISRSLGVGQKAITDVLASAGLCLRCKSGNALIANGHSVDDANALVSISTECLTKHYCVELKSMKAIASELGVSKEAVRTRLKSAGISIRSYAEQMSIDIRLGRQIAPIYRTADLRSEARLAHLAKARETSISRNTGRKRPKSVVEKMRRPRVERIAVHCEWCGTAKLMTPCSASRSVRHVCDASCGARSRNFIRSHGANEPRPVIAEKLAQLVKERIFILRELNPRTGLRAPNTYEQIEKLGAELGAREPEIEAVHLAQMEELEQQVAA